MQTQNESVLKHLRSGKKITPIEALNKFSCFRLAAVIHRIKKIGMLDKTESIESKPLTKGNKTFSQYSLVIKK